MPTPTILLAFANDWVDDKRHLRSLLDESKAIGDALSPLVEAGLLVPPPIHNATADDVINAFRVPRHRGRVRIFHFGGHASRATLLFEDQAGRPSEAHASGLAGYLGRQRGLVLVVLNGCCTEPQVQQLRQAGVKAVVATTQAIHDEVAAEFARTFYAELSARPLRDAFDTTVQAIRIRRGDDPQGVRRDVNPADESDLSGWPWILDCDPAVDAWNLGSELSRERRRTWPGRLLFAMMAVSLLLMASWAISAEARRATCRAPGVRSLCAAIGIGNTPSPAEQTLWNTALAQHSRSGLQAYLSAYPDGSYADEAQSRLAGCRTEIVETLGPKKELRHQWPVNQRLAHPLPTKEAAMRDALDRGNNEAKEHCANYRGVAEVLSAHTEPDQDQWACPKVVGGFTCGFEGHIICHVRDRIRSDDGICH